MKIALRNKLDDELVTSNNLFIGIDVEAQGYIDTDDDIFIDGYFKGSIITTGLTEFSKNAKITAKTQARALIIEGSYQGTATAEEDIVIHSCAIVRANLICKNLEIEKGASFNGQVTMS